MNHVQSWGNSTLSVAELDSVMGVSFGDAFLLSFQVSLALQPQYVSYTREQLNWFVAYAYCSHLKSFAGISEKLHLFNSDTSDHLTGDSVPRCAGWRQPRLCHWTNCFQLSHEPQQA